MIKYLSGLLAGVLLGATATAVVTHIAYPNPSNNGFSIGPLLIWIFPVWSSLVSIPAYVISMRIRPSYATAPDQKRHPVSGALAAAIVTLIAAVIVWALLWNKR